MVRNSHRLDMLNSCLNSIKLLLDLCIDQKIEAYFSFCGADSAALGYGLITLFKLHLVDEPGWDLEYVQQTISFANYFTICKDRFEEVGTTLDQKQQVSCKPCFQTLVATKMKRGRPWFDSKIAEAHARQKNEIESEMSDPMLSDGFNIDYFSQSFLDDLLAEGYLTYGADIPQQNF
jgi:hypothetical protein